LIKQGAKLTTEIEDILSEFNFDINLRNKLKRIKLSPKEEIIYEILEKGTKTIEELQKETNFPIQELLVILTNMEVKGIIKNKSGKFFLNQ
jgi:DNA processing protein